MMFHHKMFRYIAYLVIVSYVSVFNASPLLATEQSLNISPHLFAQATSSDRSSPTISAEEQEIRQRLYEENIRDLEAEQNSARGIRKNLLTVSVASMSVGVAIGYAVNVVNNAIENIPTSNPEDKDPSGTTEERIEDCLRYTCTSNETYKATTSLDAVKGIGGGIFLLGAVGLLGYFLYSRVISSKQEQIDALRAELSEGFGVTSGLSPEFLQQNEAAAAIVEEINELKKQAGSSRTIGEVFSTLGISAAVSGLFLLGVSNVSTDIVEDITVDPDNSEEVGAKQSALDDADSVQTVGWVLIGTGAVSGLVSYLYHRRARGKDTEINDLEQGLLQITERLQIQPKPDGVMVMFSYNF